MKNHSLLAPIRYVDVTILHNHHPPENDRSNFNKKMTKKNWPLNTWQKILKAKNFGFRKKTISEKFNENGRKWPERHYRLKIAWKNVWQSNMSDSSKNDRDLNDRYVLLSSMILISNDFKMIPEATKSRFIIDRMSNLHKKNYFHF